MHSIAALIVRLRYIFLLLFIAAAVYCILSVGRVKINSDFTAFLPRTTETRQGLTIMEDEFITYASEDVMIANITYETAEKLAAVIEAFDMVSSVSFDDSRMHYANASALFSIFFKGTSDDPAVSVEKLHRGGFNQRARAWLG